MAPSNTLSNSPSGWGLKAGKKWTDCSRPPNHKIKKKMPLKKEIVKEVNALSLEKQKKIVEEKWPEALLKEKVEEERTLPRLPNVEKYAHVVTRFVPNPDCMIHLGNARAIILCDEYAKMYKGSFRLRFEDTDT